MYNIFSYTKCELIGEGAFGKVYKGFDEENNRFIAIKELDLLNLKEDHLDVRFIG